MLVNNEMSGLDALKPVINSIRKAMATASVSCGVLHHGRPVWYYGDGFANQEKNLTPDQDTVYCVASCTKAFTAATCGILVRDGLLSWDQPVSNYLPDFKTSHDPEVGRRATLQDLCSHGTGLTPMDHNVAGFYNEFYNKGSEQVWIASHLPVAYDLRSQFLYNNTILGVVGDVIASVSGQSSGQVLQGRIFKPLGMNRSATTTKDQPMDGNVATGYAILDDGSHLPVDAPTLEDGGLQGAAGYVRSTVRDMLIWAKAVMDAEASEIHLRGNDAAQPAGNRSVLHDIAFCRSAFRPIVHEDSPLENTYGLGWFRHMLPSKWLGTIGPNFSLLADPPIINADGPPRLTLAHWGEFHGFLTAFYTFPATQSAVVVMANSSAGRGDPTDLIAQAIIQELFHMQPKVDLLDFACRAADVAQSRWPAIVEQWVSYRVPDTKPRALEYYEGRFECSDFKLQIEVEQLPASEATEGLNPELLRFTVNNLPRQTAKLRHYHYDTWTFIPDSRNDALHKGMENFLQFPLLLLEFVPNEAGKITGLRWDLQCEGPSPGLEKAVGPVFFRRV